MSLPPTIPLSLASRLLLRAQQEQSSLGGIERDLQPSDGRQLVPHLQLLAAALRHLVQHQLLRLGARVDRRRRDLSAATVRLPLAR